MKQFRGHILSTVMSSSAMKCNISARKDHERQLPRGVYFVRLETPNYRESRKLILTE